MRAFFLLLVAPVLFVSLAHADSDDLSGGVLLVHAPPGVVYTTGTVAWCDSTHLADCEDQVTTITANTEAVWFVLSAWAEEKSFSAVEFGLGDFDAESFYFLEDGICLDDAMAIHYPSVEDWPGPNTGIAIAATGNAWTGQLVPLCWFAGYNYAEGDTIAITENPATEHAGWLSGEPRTTYDAECLGVLGLGEEGTACCPQAESPGGHEDGESPETDVASDCSFPYYLDIAPLNRLVYRTYGHETSFGPGDLVKIDFPNGRMVINDSLTHFPHPPAPQRVEDPEVLQRRYGGIPYIQQRLGGRTDPASWNAAVRSYRAVRDSLYARAAALYDSVSMSSGTEAGVSTAIRFLQRWTDVFYQVRRLPATDPRCSGPTVLGVTAAGRSEHEFDLVDQFGLRAQAGTPPVLSDAEACDLLALLRNLETDTPAYPVTIELAFGNVAISQGRRRAR